MQLVNQIVRYIAVCLLAFAFIQAQADEQAQAENKPDDQPSQWEITRGSQYDLCHAAKDRLNRLPNPKIPGKNFKLSDGKSKFREVPKTPVENPEEYYDLVRDYYNKVWHDSTLEELERKKEVAIAALKKKEKTDDEFMWLSQFDADADGEVEEVLLVQPRMWKDNINDVGLPWTLLGYWIIPYEKNDYLSRFSYLSNYRDPEIYDGRIRYYGWHYLAHINKADFYIYDAKTSEWQPKVVFVKACQMTLEPVTELKE